MYQFWSQDFLLQDLATSKLTLKLDSSHLSTTQFRAYSFWLRNLGEEPFLWALPPLYMLLSYLGIVASFRIPAKNSHPRQLVIRLCSKDICNCWIDGKMFTGALDGSAVSTSLAGFRIEVNERAYPTYSQRGKTREIYTTHGLTMDSSTPVLGISCPFRPNFEGDAYWPPLPLEARRPSRRSLVSQERFI